jgi:hypothetical protein
MQPFRLLGVGFSIAIGLGVAPMALGQPAPRVQKNPYAALFQPDDIKASAERALAAALKQAQPHVKCAVRIIPADPKMDPKIRIDPPARDTRHTIRVMPPVCK